MSCNPEVLKRVPLFALLDEDELAVLAAQVEVREFGARQRIYKRGEPSGRAYILVTGKVRVTMVDEDGQEVVVDEPAPGEFFGFASMLDEKPHQTDAVSLEATECVEVDRHDILTLLQRKPHAGMDMLTVLGRQFHASQQLVRLRTNRNPNEVIDEEFTFGERVADSVARFGGSWAFITSFGVFMCVYVIINVSLKASAWDKYPFILLNLFLSMLAAIQAPIIMMSQNRQDKKDRVRSEMDFDVNRHAASDIQGLARKLNLLGEQIADVEDLVRTKSDGAPR